MDDDGPADFSKIQDAIDVASEGDTVKVFSGTYYETVAMKEGVTISVSGPMLTMIDVGYGRIFGANESTLSGFTITGRDNTFYCNRVSPRIIDNVITGCGGDAIELQWYSSPYISNNVIKDNQNVAVHCEMFCSPTVTNNILIRNENGLELSKSSPTVTNNVISSNTVAGIRCGYYSSPTITNNIIVDNAFWGIERQDYSSPIISYNDVWGNGIDYMDCSPGLGDISADPLFIDPVLDDYHLQYGSPCIDSGINDAPAIPEFDFDYHPRYLPSPSTVNSHMANMDTAS